MNRVSFIVIGGLTTLGLSTLALVVVPFLQLSDIAPSATVRPYSEAQLRGRAVYVREGCVYCHTQQPRAAAQAPDWMRGWGDGAKPGDYVYDTPHLLGTMRTGPDLLNVGARLPSESWHLAHLYQPRLVVEASTMPAYPYLFEVVTHGPDNRALTWPATLGAKGRYVVPTQDALDLVSYLLSLDRMPDLNSQGANNAGPRR